MSDLLRHDYINSLPQPFMVTLIGDMGEWAIYDIEVQTGLLRIDVMGKLDVLSMADVNYFTDMDGVKHEPETFYCDFEAEDKIKKEQAG